jgi:hypothetical protein
LFQPLSPNLVGVVEVQGKAQEFREYELAVFGHFIITTTGLLHCSQGVEKGVVRVLDAERMGCDNGEHLFEARILLCRNAMVNEYTHKECFFRC